MRPDRWKVKRWIRQSPWQIKGLWTPVKESKSVRITPRFLSCRGEGSVLVGIILLKLLNSCEQSRDESWRNLFKVTNQESMSRIWMQICLAAKCQLVSLHPCWAAAYMEPRSKKQFRNPPFLGALKTAFSHLFYHPSTFLCFTASVLCLLACLSYPPCLDSYPLIIFPP